MTMQTNAPTNETERLVQCLMGMQTSSSFTINLDGVAGRNKLEEAVGQPAMSRSSGQHGSRSRTSTPLVHALHQVHGDPSIGIVLEGFPPAPKLSRVREAFIKNSLKIQFFPQRQVAAA